MCFLQRQARFDDFIPEFNAKRPHEALGMKCPAEVDAPSSKLYAVLPDLAYPLHYRKVIVTHCGRICIFGKKINISTVLAGQRLGIKEVDEGIWIVSFMRYSQFHRSGAENLVTHKQPVRRPVVTHVSGTFRYLCVRSGQSRHGGSSLIEEALRHRRDRRCGGLTAW